KIPESGQGKKLMDQVSDALRTKHYSYRTEQTYVDWIKRYIYFHNKRHPSEMGEIEIRAFIAHLATERKVAASTHTCLICLSKSRAVPGRTPRKPLKLRLFALLAVQTGVFFLTAYFSLTAC
ncbi:MAG: phage integrase N-terminal SAM-like domain-containing protein, partial [Methylobacter sp.]